MSVLNVDLFYKDITEEIANHFNGAVNFDDPFMFDNEALLTCMNSLTNKNDVIIKKYDYSISKHVDEDILI